MYSIGLMSGTSMDGIDAVLCLHEKNADHTLSHISISYPAPLLRELRARIFNYDEKLSSPLANLTNLNWKVGENFGRAAVKLLKHAKQKKFIKAGEKNIIIGSHGQAIYHAPEFGQTWQLGEAACIVAATNITCVSDFRVADIANGGQGAPLLPWYHKRILENNGIDQASIHNLGGISNFTYFGKRSPKKIDLLALDTGPANCMLDTALQLMTHGRKRFDKDGKLAREGFVHLSLLDWLLSRPDVKKYRRLKAPKSTGRELFSHEMTLAFLERAEKLGLSQADCLATLSAFAVELMCEAYRRFILGAGKKIKNIYLAGGGAKNRSLVQGLQIALPNIDVLSVDTLGLNPQVVEAQAFGYFAWCTLRGEQITSPGTTGIKRPAILGKISPGDNWNYIIKG